MLDTTKIRAISLDLDDTLWPIWPVIARAEQALQDWLRPQAPRTAELLTDTEQRLALRREVQQLRPDIGHDLRTLRQELIRLALQRHGEDTTLVAPAYDVFIAERMRVELYADARPALAWLSARFPLVALSNGNADLHRVGIGEFFHAGLSAQTFGVGKPDARIFHAAAQAAGVQPHEVLHVGDDATLDVLGGLDAGMQTVWVNRASHDWAHETLRPHATVGDMAQLCALLQAPV
jgi:FMN hydrolase / 5-amino-6-(5-phospho-D-ribitylamino)uracil phosphatase